MTPEDRTARAFAWWRDFTQRLFDSAMAHNISQISDAVKHHTNGAFRMLDLGCWDGLTTKSYAPPDARVFGVELSAEAARRARYSGFSVTRADLNCPLPFRSDTFDIVTSNQVIEHLSDTDTFVSEVYRVLRPGGWTVLSTENLSSWHNVLALILGWQAFSLTNVSQRRSAIGNPLANLRHTEPFGEGWGHMRIFSHRGLLELLSAHGFSPVSILGAGYYPLPSAFGHIDPRHAAFITVIGEKPNRRLPHNGPLKLRRVTNKAAR